MTESQVITFNIFRADGWPFCPNCHEDELISFLFWNGEELKPTVQEFIDAGMLGDFYDE